MLVHMLTAVGMGVNLSFGGIRSRLGGGNGIHCRCSRIRRLQLRFDTNLAMLMTHGRTLIGGGHRRHCNAVAVHHQATQIGGKRQHYGQNPSHDQVQAVLRTLNAVAGKKAPSAKDNGQRQHGNPQMLVMFHDHMNIVAVCNRTGGVQAKANGDAGKQGAQI